MLKPRLMLALLPALCLATIGLSLHSSLAQDAPAGDKGDESAKPDAEDSGKVEEGAVREGAEELDPAGFHIGEKIDDIAVLDLDGKARRLSEDADAKAIIVAMTNESCPMTRRFASTLKALQAECEEKGVSFFYLDTTPSGKADELKKMCELRGFDATRYLHDPKGRLAKLLGVESTTDAFLLSAANLTLLYRGAVNDQFGIGVNLEAPRNTWLADALASHLAGEAIKVQATHAPGCALDFTKTEAGSTSITWNGRISRIVQENCQGCHREGENAPFTLESYEDATDNQMMIKRVVRQRRMPPWFADPEHGTWKNDARMSDEDRQAIIDWVDADAPEGDELDAPKSIEWPKGWHIGEPDLVIEADDPYTVPAAGTIRYQYNTVKVDIPEDKWVRGFEIRNSAPEAVHHVLVFIDYPRNHPRKSEDPNELGGLSGFFAGMVPGQTWIEYPEEIGKFLPKGARLTFQIHYTAVGYEVTNQTTLGMKFTDGKPTKELQTKGVANMNFTIPPGAADFEIKAHIKLPDNVRVVTLMPHAHLRGVAFTYTIREPNKAAEVLLDIPQYDFNWQLAYQYERHRYLPKGTLFQVKGVYDNSADNPANPDPKASVRFGEQTWEEMMIGYVDYYVVDDENDMIESERIAIERAQADAPSQPQPGEEDEKKDAADVEPSEDSANAEDDDEDEEAKGPGRRGILDRIRKARRDRKENK